MNNMKENTQIFKNANSISVRFGFIGIGMGGSSIASACADISTNIKNDRYPYSSLLINTNKMDLDKIEIKNPNTKKLVIGTGKGAGRNIELGEKMFKEHEEEIAKEIKSRFQSADFVWIVAGLGGGTGTGSVIEAIRLIMTNGYNKRFGLILTLPRTNEGQTVINNALQRLQMINKAMKGLGSIILVDNQKLFNEFSEENPLATIAEYLKFSNQYVAETLHEMNLVTSSFKPVGEFNFDSSEFENLIKTPGILHFARFSSPAHEIDSAQFISHGGKLKEEIENGVLSSGYDLENTSRLAVSVLANRISAARLFNFQFIKPIESELEKMAPLANENPIAQYVYDDSDSKLVYFYAALAGLKLPQRVNELVKENIRLIELQKRKEEKTDDIFAGFEMIDNSSRESSSEPTFDDLFGSKQKEKKEVENISSEAMFNGLFGDK